MPRPRCITTANRHHGHAVAAGLGATRKLALVTRALFLHTLLLLALLQLAWAGRADSQPIVRSPTLSPSLSQAGAGGARDDVLSVLGLAIKDAQGRLRQARAVCDAHQVAAARDAISGMLGLAACFKTGSGRPKRLLRAKALYEAAAARGSARAELALGQFYRDGAIVTLDLAQAARHFRRAARAGLAEAMIEYGLVLGRAQADHRMACRWFKRSAQANARSGIRLLGDCFARGVGGRRDRAHATTLYRRAAVLGDPTARLKLAGHPFRGAGSDIARWEGCAWARRSAARNNIAAMRAAAFGVGAYANVHLSQPRRSTKRAK